MLVGELTLGRRWTFVGGKGGVGKTTVAAALAVERADAGEEVLVVSVDPAHSLGDALGLPLGAEPEPIPGTTSLRAFEVNATRERDRFLAEHREALERLIERGTYLDADDAQEVSGRAVPGLDELAALLRLGRLAREVRGRVVVDTAPTGHALRLFELPSLALDWIGALEAMESKHAAVAVGLVGEYRGDAATAFLADLRRDVEAVRAVLEDPVDTRVILVTTPEHAVVAETLRYQEALRRLGIGLGGVVVNRSERREPPEGHGAAMIHVPLVEDPVGLAGLRGFAAAAGRDEPGQRRVASPPRPSGVQIGGRYIPPLDRRFYIVGGKGGVGKSTAAAALAIRVAAEGRRVLLIGVDPAGSLAEVLAMPVGEEETGAAEGPTSLRVKQVDAHAAWGRFVDRYQNQVAQLFGGSPARSVSATFDQLVMERLVDLAPPGLDELVALLEMVDVTEDREYDALVLDTAPTGHLLRLLEMPDLALEWCHTLMRLLLKYREIVHPGEFGQEVLTLSRRIRAFRERLVDPVATWFLAVALPESLSLPETRRLLEGVRRTGVHPGGLLINRALADGDPASGAALWIRRLVEIDPSLPAMAAPVRGMGPAGTAELRRFVNDWRIVTVA